MRSPAVLLAAAFMLALGGCSGAAVTSISDNTNFSYSDFVYLTSGRDTRVVVRGNPFDMDQKAFEKAVTDAMQGQHFGPRTNFTTGPSETAREDIRVVMLFNGPETVRAHQLCEASGTFGSVQDAKALHVTAAFCNQSVAWSEVYARAGSVPGVESPTFARLVAQTTMDLFPLRDDDILDKDRDSPLVP